MKFVPRKRSPTPLTPIAKLLRVLAMSINRIGGMLFIAGLTFFIYLAHLSDKPTTAFIGPPEAEVVQRAGGRARLAEDALQCGCTYAETCSTSVPVGSFRPDSMPDVLPDSVPLSQLENEQRRRHVRQMAAGAWAAYAEHALGADELRPASMTRLEEYGGVGATVVESLGTLYIMDLQDEYKHARDWVDMHLDFDSVKMYVSVYHVTNRILGGLMSAYQLTADEMFLEKAEDLGRRLSHAFMSANGVPYPRCHLGGPQRDETGLLEDELDDARDEFPCHGLKTSQSEAGGLSLELRALAYHSLLPYIRDLRCKADRAVQAVIESGPSLLRTHISEEFSALNESNETSTEDNEREASSASYLQKFSSASSYYSYMVQVWHRTVTAVGAGPIVDTTATFSKPARAFYEYLAKAWRQGGECESYLRYPLDASMHMLLKRAIHESPTHDLYLRAFDSEDESSEAVVDQSMCYLPSLFHLAAKHKSVSPRRLDQWLDVAEGITKSCVNMYDRFPGFLGGDSARFNGGLWITKGAYKLQADLVEAIFYMWRSTQNSKYREIAWSIAKNIDLQCKVENGAFTLLEEKVIGNITKGDRMPSEFLGATLKFLYLTFASNEQLPLSDYVFNRAGHPLLVTPALGAINTCHSEFV